MQNLHIENSLHFIDTLEFKAPARQGDLIEVTAKIVFTSNRTACARE